MVNTPLGFVKDCKVELAIQLAQRNFAASISRAPKTSVYFYRQQRYLTIAMKYIFFCIPLIISGFAACTEDNPKQKQSLECYVRYLVPEGQLRAEATLRVSTDTTQIPKPVATPGGFQYQDVIMHEVQSRGTAYVAERVGGYSPKHQFTWQDDKGVQHRFDMEMAPVTAFAFDQGATLQRNKPAVFTWQGAPLEKGEALVYMWESVDGRLTIPMDVVGMPGQDHIEFPAAKLAELAPGRWTLYIVRKKLTRTNIDGIDARGIVEFYSKVDTLTVQ